MNVIQYLEQNSSLVTLLKEQNKASLIGISSIEQQAILEAFNGELNTESQIWN
ncbi:competence pheromone ComX [Lysinibacillus macroides]|uniref:ComX pheromone n=1 Tax=Lysinibacillus macroides TaxID=33935 RepID=A0A0M9DHB4_9BACI|nr:competence pheromone ComX [Lysinibacillus macroides]KOY80416.1 competence protein ComX [Lysinibacillus macroides]QPR67728.1 competence pheromone ComX [Lysinibacillus macroides]